MIKEFLLESFTVVERVLKDWAVGWISGNVQVPENNIKWYLRVTNGGHHFRSRFFDGMKEILCRVKVEANRHNVHKVADDP